MEEEYVFDKPESPPSCATVEKNPFNILAAMKLLNVVAAAHHIAVRKVKITK